MDYSFHNSAKELRLAIRNRRRNKNFAPLWAVLMNDVYLAKYMD